MEWMHQQRADLPAVDLELWAQHLEQQALVAAASLEHLEHQAQRLV
jgi:hypothetical protein